MVRESPGWKRCGVLPQNGSSQPEAQRCIRKGGAMSTFQKACRKGYKFQDKFAQSRRTLMFFAVARIISCTESLLFINDISDFF